MKETFEVIFNPEKIKIDVRKKEMLSDLALRAGIVLNAVCGGKGICGKCRVRVLKGKTFISSQERKIFTSRELKEGWRLACKQRIEDSLEVEVPQTSRLYEQKILTSGSERNVRLNPFIKKVFISVERPRIKEQLSYVEKIRDSCGLRAQASLSFLRKISLQQAKKRWTFTVVAADGQLLSIEEGDTRKKNYGVAFDLGTTTIVGYLLDLCKGEELGHITATNPQIKFGEDVVSRISHCNNDEGLLQLHKEVISCLNRMLCDISKENDISPSDIYQVTVAGNTTMQHLFLCIDPSPLARAPYIGIFREAVEVDAESIGLCINPCGKIFVLPSIAGFVGGDTVAFILSHFLEKKRSIRLGIDIGTNGEVVLARNGEILTCSTAAGPAFEGARITCGMRAENGAIDRTRINHGKLEVHVIGEGKPRGICGSGLVSVVSELLKAGIIDETGRIKDRRLLQGRLPEQLLARITEDDGERAFVLNTCQPTGRAGPPTGRQTGVRLTQKDIRELQLAKAAIRAGVQILLNEWSINVEDIEEVLLAGAFGNYTDRNEALRIGIIPPLPPEKIKSVGNASGTGAKMYLFNKSYRKRSEKVSQQTRYIELAGRKDFMEEFSNFILFPKGS